MSNAQQVTKAPAAAPGLDISSARTAPVRTIDVRQAGESSASGFLLVAVTTRPEGGFKETALNPFAAIGKRRDAELMAEAVARAVEHVTGVMFEYPGVNGPTKEGRK